MWLFVHGDDSIMGGGGLGGLPDLFPELAPSLHDEALERVTAAMVL